MTLPMPWGASLEPQVRPLQLLELPLAFTQNDLLSPDEFVKRADQRGVQLRVEHLVELHRKQALVPLLRITQRPPKSSEIVAVPATAANAYRQFRSPIALVIAAGQHGYLMDPGPAPFRRWDGGLPLPVHGRVHRYPSVFYSPYQLLALRQVRDLVGGMTATRGADGSVTFSLDPLTTDEASALDGCRRLAVVLSAFDMYYLPRILRTARLAREWEEEDPRFDATPPGTARPNRRIDGGYRDSPAEPGQLPRPARPVVPPHRQGDPSKWPGLRGDALLAMDYRIAAEILLRTLDDLGRQMNPHRLLADGRMYRTTLDDRLRGEPERLEGVLSEHGLSSRPAVLLVLEGETEIRLMPRALAEFYGKPVPPRLSSRR